MADRAESNGALEPTPIPAVERRIHVVRGRQVMLDEDLAELYGVETGGLTRAVRRNQDRFPEDFMFQLTNEEWAALRRQSGISSAGRHGGRRYAPYVFSEQGVAMLSGVLRSKRAVAVHIAIMRAFVALRGAAISIAAMERRLEELEQETTTKFGQHDRQLSQIFEVLRQLICSPPPPRRQVGFRLPEEDSDSSHRRPPRDVHTDRPG